MGPDESPPATSVVCSRCSKVIVGQFVRALNQTYHLNCFRCLDCNEVVSEKFYPATDQNKNLYPLCESDYYKRYNLICDKCGQVIRGSYISALNKKYHLKHFSCSVQSCPVVFGPHDSYYEHNGQVYCYYHYSIYHAMRCAGCGNAILKQFVETTRNNSEDQWHPECYMIYKSWSIRLSPLDDPERSQTPTSQELRSRQKKAQEKIYLIWTVLSAFEESAASSISNMLMNVSSGSYLISLLEAESFVMHVEILFNGIDQVELMLSKFGDNSGLMQKKEPKMLAKKVVNFFTLLSHTRHGVGRLKVTQELLSLVTSLAKHLKSLVRGALNNALKLEKKYGVDNAVSDFLNIIMEISPEDSVNRSRERKPVAEVKSDLCFICRTTVEEACYRIAPNTRCHRKCFQCANCEEPLNGTDKIFLDSQGKNIRLFCGKCAKLCNSREREGLNEISYEFVTMLQQYAFLLRVALKRLYTILQVKEEDVRLKYEEKMANELSAKQISDASQEDQFTSSSSPSSEFANQPIRSSLKVARRQTIIESIPSEVDAPIELVQLSSKNDEGLSQSLGLPPRMLALPPSSLDNLAHSNLMRKPSVTLRQQNSSIGDTKFISELGPLESLITKQLAVLSLAPIIHEYYSLAELLDLIEARKSSLWGRFMTSLKSNKKVPKKDKVNTFQVPLDILVEKDGVDTYLGASPIGVKIPYIIHACIAALKQMDLQTEGIFRKNGNIRRLNTLAEEIDKNPTSVDLSQDNPIQIGALLKKFLRELPDPLLTFKLYQLFVTTQKLKDPEARKKALHYSVCLLPKPNRDLLEVLLIFLSHIANNASVVDNSGEEKGNLMDAENLATVIAPNVCYPPKDTSHDDSMLAINVVKGLIENQFDFCTVPEDIWKILQEQEIPEGVDMSQKSIMKKWENRLQQQQKLVLNSVNS